MLMIIMMFSTVGCSNAPTYAVVNGVKLTESDFNQFLPLYYSAEGIRVEQVDVGIKEYILGEMINQEVIAQHFSDKKDAILGESIDSEFEEYKAAMEADQAQVEFMTSNNISYEYLKKVFINQRYMDYFNEQVAQAVKALKNQQMAEYAKDQSAFEQVRAMHILVSDEAAANDIIKKLNDGKDFNTLAYEFSIDPSVSENGGDLGYTSKGDMVEEFEKVAFSLPIGQISKPVETQYGYHIIKVIDRRVPTFDELFVSGGALYDKLFTAKYEEMLAQIKTNMKIEKNPIPE